MKTEKPQADCLRESITLLQKLVSLGIPLESPETQELKKYLDAYIKDGECWNGTISFMAYGRMADVNLPRKADKTIEVTLKHIKRR